MTIDVDYEHNWNKENLPAGGSVKKMILNSKLSPSKRNILGELHGIATEPFNPKRGRSHSQPNVPSAVNEHDMELEKQKWANIAVTLHCENENNEERLMDELLELCSWYDSRENSTLSSTHRRCPSCDLCDVQSDEEDEDDAFIEYTQSKQFVFSTSYNKQLFGSSYTSNATLNNSTELHLSPLRLLSLLDSPQSSFIISDYSHSDMGACLGSQNAANVNMDGSVKMSDRSTKDNLNAFISKGYFLPTTATFFAQSMSKNTSSSEKLEKAFLGVITDDNDTVESRDQIKSLKRASPGSKSENESLEAQVSGAKNIDSEEEDFWADVNFY